MRFTGVLTTGALLALAATAQHAVASAEPTSSPTPTVASTVATNPGNGKLHRTAGKSAGKTKHSRAVKPVRSKFLMDRFETLNGAKGSGESPASRDQEDYDNRAYPATAIGAAQQRAAANAAASLGKLPGGKKTNWQPVGPYGVTADALVASESTGGTAAGIYSGRATAIAISPACGGNDCKIFIGAAGGGVWEADNALAPQPNWASSGNGIPSNAIGSIAFDPSDPVGRTLYVGTGEPNGSSDSEAGVGLYKSTDAGKSWTVVPGSVAVSANRSIGSVAIDPANPNHIFIGTDVARHGSSSVNGGRFTPPAAPPVGLYESTDGGVTFSPVLILAQDSVDGGNPTGGDFFRGGVSNIQLYRTAGETQVYASAFDYGVFRRSMTQDGDANFHPIFNSAGGGTVANSPSSRTEFSLAPNAGSLRVYVGDSGNGASADFYRVDNANVPAAALLTGGTNGGWLKLSNPANGTPGFASRNFCATQCSYDMPVLSPPGAPDIVYIGGASQYSELGGRSNGRDIQRSEDAGVSFTDMTVDSQGVSLHPDEHAIAATPTNPNIVFIGNDGGIFRLNGSFTDISSQCAARGLSGNNLVDCQHWLAKVPTTLTPVNKGLQTQQFQSLSVNTQAPLTDIMGGTQDDGTQAMSSKGNGNGKGNTDWFVSIFGDGGQSGIDIANPEVRMHTFFSQAGASQIDVNFRFNSNSFLGFPGNETGWNWVGDAGSLSGENMSFYIPLIHDPKTSGTWFFGAQHVFRTQDNAGNQAFLEANCSEFVSGLQFTGACGDWAKIGADLTGTGFGTDKTPGPNGYVVAISRAPSDTGTVWVGLRRGRVFVASNADTAIPGNVVFSRIDGSAQPERFVSGISVDASNPNHAFISYSGYDAYATATGTATGHLFEVIYNPVTRTATWSGDLASNLGDQPITGIAVDWNTGDAYVSTDFGVFVRLKGNSTWQPAAGSLPPVAVYGLTLDVNGRVLYAATHGRGAWRLQLP
ncbi:MAG: exo-alpha-sialidase [Proteobacteria bacterium]|nr:exo-alpha-sialidase [Pseudomonadota bacterium]